MWAGDVSRDIADRIALGENGLMLGYGSRLVRFDPRSNRLGVMADRERCLALLAIATRSKIAPDAMIHFDAAADYWHQGDKALANLRLVFSGLPRLRDEQDAARLLAAECLLDHGLTPRELLGALDIDPSPLGLRKHDPNQPRVPAGQGKESGAGPTASGSG